MLDRTSATEMANDCWYLSVSLKNNRIESECFETIFKSGNSNHNRSQPYETNLHEKDNDRLNKLIGEVETMKAMIDSLILNNKTLIQLNKETKDEIKILRNENQSLKKLILEHNTNMTINREIRCSETSVESVSAKRRKPENDITSTNYDTVFKVPQTDAIDRTYNLQANNRRTFATIMKENGEKEPRATTERKRSTNKTKVIIGKGKPNESGLNVATRNHHFYVGNLHIDTATKDVEEFINKFAKVDKIFQLKTKHKYYTSFYVEVNESYNDKMNDPSNWPSNVRIKRFYHGKHSKLEEHIVTRNDEQRMETSVGTIKETIIS
jgi:ribosomal protein L31